MTEQLTERYRGGVAMTRDYPLIRETPRCMLCGSHTKPHHGLMCWGCFNSGGSDGAFDSRMDLIEAELAADEDAQVSP